MEGAECWTVILSVARGHRCCSSAGRQERDAMVEAALIKGCILIQSGSTAAPNHAMSMMLSVGRMQISSERFRRFGFSIFFQAARHVVVMLGS